MHLVLAHGEEGDAAQGLETEPGQHLQGRLLDTQILEKGLALLGAVEQGDLRFDLGRDDHGLHAGVAAQVGDPVEQAGVAQAVLAHVEDEDHLLAGDQRIAADEQVLLVAEGEQAQRRPVVELGLQPLEQIQFLLLAFVLHLLDRGFQPLDPFFQEHLVMEEQLVAHHLHIAQRVHRTGRMVDRLVLEGAHHVAEGVDIADIAEDIAPGDGLLFHLGQEHQVEPRPRFLFWLVHGH